MERSRKTNGVPTFFEHWGLLFTAAVSLLTMQVLLFFEQLSGAPWIWFFAAGFGLLIIGGCLVVYAKLPAYRNGHFFTFGVRTVPGHLAGYYRWGWRVFLFGVVLSLCLLLSKSS